MKFSEIEKFCFNPECPEAGKCNGTCAKNDPFWNFSVKEPKIDGPLKRSYVWQSLWVFRSWLGYWVKRLFRRR